MSSNETPDCYRQAYARLETTLTDLPGGGPTPSSRPAVLQFPEDADITAHDINEAITSDDLIPVAPYIDDGDDGFYYAVSRIYRLGKEPDISIRADATALRLFEFPDATEDPLPELSFEEFVEVVEQIEENLGLTFLPYDDE